MIYLAALLAFVIGILLILLVFYLAIQEVEKTIQNRYK
jgi:uncharacterized integral membrane protein